MRELLDWGDHCEAQQEGSSSPRQSPAKEHTRAHADLVPAGGNAGLVRPPGTSGGRRGSLGKAVSLAGGGAARVFCWEQGTEDRARRQDDVREMEEGIPCADPLPHEGDQRPQSPCLYDCGASAGGGTGRESGSIEVCTFMYKRVV